MCSFLAICLKTKNCCAVFNGEVRVCVQQSLSETLEHNYVNEDKNTGNVRKSYTPRCVRVTIVATKKQHVLNTMGVCF